MQVMVPLGLYPWSLAAVLASSVMSLPCLARLVWGQKAYSLPSPGPLEENEAPMRSWSFLLLIHTLDIHTLPARVLPWWT